ncbi:Calmodulin-regulated spectrin-associated protein 2 [Saguinus oedipus]|uniref:Calmodulin-regulated spectrin-associated protein 2 n=1 Tax=Saguinus oedipus TaxID=9490 RepID=A0ABQ9TNV3_SAGOE|nr:Calmodulin-regulated spectrin-associated protein 2 [Saguinus oedipus]
MSLADSLYNLQLIQEFCQEYLNQCCHFTLEDMLYAASSIKADPVDAVFALVDHLKLEN